jgi:MATE family multidrug resistance protein
MLELALPVVLTNLGLMLMGVVDVIFVGHVSATAIGAVGLGTSIFYWLFIFGIGLLMGLDYLVSFAEGAQRPEDGHHALVQALIATTALSVPLTALLLILSHHLDWFGINPAVQLETTHYLDVIAWSLWPALIFSAARQYLTARGVARPAMIILVLANLLNAVVNYVLIFGHWGFAPMGVTGSAVATLASRLAMMISMGIYLLLWDRRRDRLFEKFPLAYDREKMRAFLKLGLPSAFQMTFEVGVFGLSTALAARLTADALAAHQIVLNIASLTFMVPLGLSSATAVLVGQALGRGDPKEATHMGWYGLGLGVGFMGFSGLMLYVFAQPILSIFTNDPGVRIFATQIILIAALFQLSDGAQAVTTGALRGVGDTRSAMIANLCGHWLVGLPVGLLLCFKLGWGLQGLWVGLSLGLTVVAAVLLAIWRLRSREAGRS